MADIGILDAKTHLSNLVERALSGEEVHITRHGRRVARLVPERPAADTRRVKAVKAMQKFVKSRPVGTLDPVKVIREMREERMRQLIR